MLYPFPYLVLHESDLSSVWFGFIGFIKFELFWYIFSSVFVESKARNLMSIKLFGCFHLIWLQLLIY